MELKDYYAILGVQPTDDLKTIKTAYRRLARKYHPDVSKESDAEAKFKDLAEAWEVLKDEQRRAEYDQLWQHRNDPGFGRQQTHERLQPARFRRHLLLQTIPRQSRVISQSI